MKEKRRRIDLSNRDIAVLEFLLRFRCALSRSIAVICGFKNLSDCEKRLKKMADFGLVIRKKVFADMPYIYAISTKGIKEIGYEIRQYDIHTGTVEHETGIAEIAAYLYITTNITFDDLITDRDMMIIKKIGSKEKYIHRGDLIYVGEKSILFEYERTQKNIKRFKQNFRSNVNKFDEVWYFYDTRKVAIKKHLEAFYKEHHKEPHIIDMNILRETVEQYNLKYNTLKRNPNADRNIERDYNNGGIFKKKSSITTPGSWRDLY